MLVFKDDTLKSLRYQAQSEYPSECCGILLGRRENGLRIVFRIFSVRNSADEGSRNTHFCIDPLETVRAELSAMQEQLEIVGFYHSHPDQEARASENDIRYMIPGYSYPIISVRDGKTAEIRCFEKTDIDDPGITEEQISS